MNFDDTRELEDLLNDWYAAFVRYSLWSRRQDGLTNPVYIDQNTAMMKTSTAEVEMECAESDAEKLGVTAIGWSGDDTVSFMYKGDRYDYDTITEEFKPEIEVVE